jgi:valyl-tRNA synthetase
MAALAARRESHLGPLKTLSDMARAGRKLRLPLTDRVIPLIHDEWANPMLGSGCVKITPAHDANDYNVGIRNNLAMINVLTPDGKVAPIIEPDASTAPTKPGGNENLNSEKYAGLAFSTEGRTRVVADMEALGRVEAIEDRDIEVGHSDRSKLPIEPYLSDQWFVRTGESSESIAKEGLAASAMRAVEDGRIAVHPSRYAKSYLDWLGEKRDWCISRQLWWGHRIPVWHKRVILTEENWTDNILSVGLDALVPGRWKGDDSTCTVAFCRSDTGRRVNPYEDLNPVVASTAGSYDIYLCSFNDDDVKIYEKEGYTRDEDVLDTWFSSALWPFSTLGWPEETTRLEAYFPGSVLVTSRDIITNWVARMVMFALHKGAMGEVPFRHVYIHPKILDGRGETMSKSKGNGVDPIDIIHTHGADALRYSMADLTTETQDIRMPVDYLCPHCGKLTEQAAAIRVEEQNRKSRGQKLERKLQPADCQRVKCAHKECGREFATQWADAATKEQLGIGRETSEKFEIGRNFCNKLWNAARYAFMNLEKPKRRNGKTRKRCHAGRPSISRPDPRFAQGDAVAFAPLRVTKRRRCARGSVDFVRIVTDHSGVSSGNRAYQFSASVKELREFSGMHYATGTSTPSATWRDKH